MIKGLKENKHPVEEEKLASSETGGVMRWMLTYLDMVTLLFGVFVLLYSMSTINTKKFDEVAKAIRESFLSGVTLYPGLLNGGKTPLSQFEGAPRENVYNKLVSSLKPEVQSKFVSVNQEGRDIFVTIFDQYYFATGSAEISEPMKEVLTLVADFLTENPQYDMRIEGHADVQPVNLKNKGEDYDNWNLAADRAINVIKFFTKREINPDRMQAVSFGNTHPLNYPFTPEARALNRRVDLVIFTDKKYEDSKKKILNNEEYNTKFNYKGENNNE